MTDQLQAGPEGDARVARALGWEKQAVRYTAYGGPPALEKWMWVDADGRERADVVTWHPTTDPVACAEVRREMERRGGRWQLHWDGSSYSCAFDKLHSYHAVKFADTEELATCRAVVAAVTRPGAGQKGTD